jgi:hypothetical protein
MEELLKDPLLHQTQLLTDVKSVDISIVVRSSKAFYRSQAMRTITSIATGRDISKDDKYFRDSITVTANTRNLGI